MHLIPPGAFNVSAKAHFIGGALLWVIVTLWRTRGQWHKVRVAFDGFTIGVLVCMVLFWVLLIGGRFWGGAAETQAVMSLLVLLMAGLIFWRRREAD
jgi:drug/metabolite transporter (DMT)-like permease